ncbi:FkbH domain containing protein [Trema orientale]|uniref:FkbH domain containing protein n=1 Tax=Trema orientale TaxID=63057 RepID=A0A2P5FWH9_TREOI|nr:FkbH domain containing protein [Trema orientale]
MADTDNSSPPETAVDFRRISLRPFDVADIDDYMAWAPSEGVSRFCSWEPNFSREEGMKRLKSMIFYHPWIRSICLDGKSIGEISVKGFSGGGDRHRAEMGYVIGSDYWGRGIATLAVGLVAEAIFWEWPHLERLEAVVDVENVASQRVLEKVGFVREGVLRKFYYFKGKSRDMVMYSLLSDHHVSQD